MPLIEITPEPAGTLQALAGGGYTPQSAVADLIDNAITAQASQISLTLSTEGNGLLTLTDNGKGMDESTLIEAMRVAGQHGKKRQANDLGRYGTGLKAAGLFLSRTGHFQVTTAQIDGQGHRATLDVQDMELSGKWLIDVCKCDTPRGTTLTIHSPLLPLDDTASIALKELSDHLRITFANHLANGLEIRVQGHLLNPWPLCYSWPEVSSYSARKIGGARVTPFILPTHQDDPMIEGPQGRHTHAGIHVHRLGRAITTGGWQGIGTGKRYAVARDRIRLLVEIDASLDEAWKVTLSKSGCTIPGPVKTKIKATLEDVLDRAGRQRAVRQTPSDPDGLWGPKHRIRRDHPLVVQALHSSQTPEMIETLLKALEAGRGSK